MIRNIKYFLLTSCALVLLIPLCLQLRDYKTATVRETLSSSQTVHIQNLPVNVSSTSQTDILLPVTLHQMLYLTTAAYHNPVPPDDVLKRMTHLELHTFYHSYVNSPQATCSRVERMGLITDGGWELCDEPLYRPPKGDCLVYSYGINNDFYDDEMAAYGCEVHAFDPSMNTPPHRRSENVFFHTSGVGGKDGLTFVPLKNVEWQVYTIGGHRRLLQHTPDQRRLDIVKMDVEGHELESLRTALDEGSLSDVRQLAFETHVAWGNSDPTKEQYIEFLALLRKLYEHGFRIYLTHRNFLYSAFNSRLEIGKKRVFCHEIHTVNINNVNSVNADGSIFGDDMVSDSERQERRNLQEQLLSQEKALHPKRTTIETSKQHFSEGNVPNMLSPVHIQPQPVVQAQPPLKAQFDDQA